MGCLKADKRRAAFVGGLQEPAGTKTPAIPRGQTGKAIFGARCGQVIADIFGIGEELSRHDRTNGMAALILSAGVAVPIAKEAGERAKRAGRQRPAQYIYALILFHTKQLTGFAPAFGTFRY